MKNKGFSLMEVLMVLGIIGVVTAMSISISQKGLEKAYRNYWYTGYSALENATFDAIMKNQTGFSAFTEHVAKLMNAEIADATSSRILTAPNGIKYTFGAVPFNAYGFWPINMEIPSPKTKKTVKNVTLLVVDFGDQNNVQLRPAPVGTSASSNYVNLQTRKDLLPFVINDGKAPNESTKNKNIYSFQEAYCATHADGIPIRANTFPMTVVQCTHNDNPIAGQIMSINPKKVY